MGEKKKQVGATHKALYRKYRSKSLEEIVGQEHITKTLANAIKQGKISHAYLLTGPKGTGKTSVARILAHELNNLPYTDDSMNLDIIEIDAASNRRIDDIRDLRDKVNIAPVSAKYKVYIIDEVHMLTSESFNALLKTLEEPPEHVIFILATTEVHKLPATIVSRVQRHSFHSIAPEKVAAHLKTIAKNEDIKIDDEALLLLAEYGDGSFRDSISMLDQMSSSTEQITVELVELLLGLAPQRSLSELFDAAQVGDSKLVLSQIDSLIEAGLTPVAIAAQLLKLLRNKAKDGTATAQTVSLMKDLLGVSSSQYPQLKLESILLGVAPRNVEQIVNNTQQIESRPEPVATTPSIIRPKELDGKTDQSNVKTKKTEASPDPSSKTPENKNESSSKTEASESNENSPINNSVAPVSEDNEARHPKQNEESSVPATLESGILGQWPEILTLTKQKNNSLYTVLRLATPELQGNELTLVFAFPFHQKKLAEPKYKSLVAEIVREQTGADTTITAVVDKSRIKPINSAPAAIDNNAHASLISNVQDIMGGGEIVSI